MKRIIAAATIALCFASISAFAASAGEVRYRVTIRDTEIAPVEEIAASLAGTYGGEVSSGDVSGRSFVIVTTPERAKLMLENRSVARIESLSAGSNAHAPRMTTNTQVDLGTYLYDGSGNIRTIDIDNYIYDKVGRVKTATVSSVSQSYDYDAFGNLNTITTGGGVLCAGQVVCGRALTISSQTNHITSDNAHYTDAGSLDSLDSYTFTYDDLGMMTQQRIGTAIVRQFVYTADDERLATYVPSGVWNWTVRDLSGAVLRTYTSQDSGSNLAAANWQWNEDYIYRGSLLLATKSALGVRHLHLDHLGSPRLITDDSGHQTGIHKYLPFGAELNVGTRENPEEPRKFTGHERDGLNVASTLDYMHTRYYGWGMGRFLSVDPVLNTETSVSMPQRWNRYSYVVNSPMARIDPNGRADIPAVYASMSRRLEAWAAKIDRVAGSPLLKYTPNAVYPVMVTAAGVLHDGAATLQLGTTAGSLTSTSTTREKIDAAGVELNRAVRGGILIGGILGAVYRGGSSLVPKGDDLKIINGQVLPGRGLSLNADASVVEKFGGAYRVESLPEGLQIIQRGNNPLHFEITPVSPMAKERFLELLEKVVLVAVEKK